MTTSTLSIERDGHLLLMGLNRPEERNAFDVAMLEELSLAYGELESDDDLRAGVLFANGDHFTGGLHLISGGPNLAAGKSPFPENARDPWRLDGPWSKS